MKTMIIKTKYINQNIQNMKWKIRVSLKVFHFL